MRLRLPLLAAVAAAAIGLAACGNGVKLSEKTLKLTEKENQNDFGFADTPPKSPPSKGEPTLSNADQITFNAALLDSAKKKVGRLDATCVVTEGKGGFDKSFSTCLGTATVPGGSLTLSVGGRFNQKTTRGAVVGGTGDYEGATGGFTSTEGGQGKPSADTFHLFVPKK